MKDLLELIVKNIVTNSDDVVIEEQAEDGRVNFIIHVHPDDMGRVIGKQGNVIKAIRSIGHVVGIRNDQHFRVNVAESGDQEGGQAQPSGQMPQDDPQQDDTQDDQIGEDIIADAMEMPEDE